jgi:hypothetical protein
MCQTSNQYRFIFYYCVQEEKIPFIKLNSFITQRIRVLEIFLLASEIKNPCSSYPYDFVQVSGTLKRD